MRWKEGKVEISIESDGSGEANESGGGRYKKNMITIGDGYTLEITAEGFPEIKHSGSIEVTTNAGSYEECC
jgi:hypothetical protein